MLIYRYILDSLEDENVDGWGVLNPKSDSLRIIHKPKLDRLEINHKPIK